MALAAGRAHARCYHSACSAVGAASHRRSEVREVTVKLEGVWRVLYCIHMHVPSRISARGSAFSFFFSELQLAVRCDEVLVLFERESKRDSASLFGLLFACESFRVLCSTRATLLHPATVQGCSGARSVALCVRVDVLGGTRAVRNLSVGGVSPPRSFARCRRGR